MNYSFRKYLGVAFQLLIGFILQLNFELHMN